MPLRNHEQVLLLNDRSEPQTHITHQTQNSAIGGLGNFGKSPKLSTYIGGQKNRATSNSMMGATTLTHVSNPAVAPLYLDTTNILSSNKVNKVYGNGRHTDNGDEDGSYGEEDDIEVHSQEEDGRKVEPKKKNRKNG
jgi:hypothetical protein